MAMPPALAAALAAKGKKKSLGKGAPPSGNPMMAMAAKEKLAAMTAKAPAGKKGKSPLPPGAM